jgi:hypothetical protein
LPGYSGSDDDEARWAEDPADTRHGADETGAVPAASSRILSSLVDVFVCGFLYLVFSFVLAAGIKPQADGLYTSEQLRTLQLWTIGFVLVLAVLFSVAQSRGMRTLGKRVTGLRLVGPADVPATLGRLLVKYALTFAIFAALGLLGLLVVLVCLLSAGLQRQRRNVFDQVSGLRAVASPR